MNLKNILEKTIKKTELVGIWETRHGNKQENLLHIFEDGTGIIFVWQYETNNQAREVVYEIEWKKIWLNRIAFKLKNE